MPVKASVPSVGLEVEGGYRKRRTIGDMPGAHVAAEPSPPHARWDRALPAWGAITVVVLTVGALAGVAGGFAGDSLAGSAGLLATIEAGLVTVGLLFVLLSG